MPTHQLLFGFTRWGMAECTDNMFLSDTEMAETLLANGYSVLEADYDAWCDTAFRGTVLRHGLIPVIQCYPMTPNDLLPALQLAADIGARFINAHAATPYLSPADAAAFVRQSNTLAAEAGVALLFETHRGRITQDLYRTSQLAQAVNEMRFNLDVSHFVLAGETPGPAPSMMPLLEPILDRTLMLHARICNGEQIQISLDTATTELLACHEEFWTEAMRRWRLHALPGTALIFTPELGPPPYAPVAPDGKETTDRWVESLRLRDLALRCWQASAT